MSDPLPKAPGSPVALSDDVYNRLVAKLDMLERVVGSGAGGFVSGINPAFSARQQSLPSVMVYVSSTTNPDSEDDASLGYGMYGGYILFDLAALNTTDTPALPIGMSVPDDTTNALIIDLADFAISGSTTTAVSSTLALPCYRIGRVVGRCLDDPAIRIVVLDGEVGVYSDSAIMLPHGTFSSPDISSWSREANSTTLPGVIGGCAVKWDPFWLGFDGSGGTGTWFMMTRTAIYDARGRLYKVSAEVKTTIGTNLCPLGG